MDVIFYWNLGNMIYNGLITLRLCGFPFAEIGVASPPPEYKSSREIKRAKRTEEKKATSAKDSDGAGSLEECRHPQ